MASITWQQLLGKLREIFSGDDELTEEKVAKLMRVMNSYKSNREDWNKYVTARPDRYTRNLVDTDTGNFNQADIQNGKYNLIVLCWGVGQGSPIHNHDNSHCIMKILGGCLKETQFVKPSGAGTPVKEHSCKVHQTDDVTYIRDAHGVVHKVENPSENEVGISLHLYCPPLVQSKVYVPDSGAVDRIGKMTFDTINGNSV